MRIDGKIPYAPLPGGLAVRPGTAGGRFEVAGQGGARSSTGVRTSAPLATMDAILALQGEQDPAERRRRQAKRGSDLLDALDGLKAQILSGRVNAGTLQALADRIAETGGSSGDPGLDEVIGEIELRVQVELAKFGNC